MRHPLRWLAPVIATFLLICGNPTLAQTPDPTPSLPAPAVLDALDTAQWSVTTLEVVPGQKILVTNRGVIPHTFAVAEWGMEDELPTLKTVEITVPKNLSPGERFTFFCSVGNHRSEGQEGSIVIISSDDARATQENKTEATPTNQQLIVEMRDDNSFTPDQLSGAPGQLIELHNRGVLEHHFVVDGWNVNVTVTPGAKTLVQIPTSVSPGETFVYYCSVPGHRERGMVGQLVIAQPSRTSIIPSVRRDRSNSVPSLSRFVPAASVIGTQWQQVRSGNARAIIPALADLSTKIFPGEGRGAVYTGPNGSRAAIVVLPLTANSVPTNQLEDAMIFVQSAMTQPWDTSGLLDADYADIPPPPGCDVVDRVGGITSLYTLPAGATSCQLRGPGIAIFVAVEGQVENKTSVEASDLIMELLLKQAISGNS